MRERSKAPEFSESFSPKHPTVSMIPERTNPKARISAVRSWVPRKRTKGIGGVAKAEECTANFQIQIACGEPAALICRR